MDYSEMITAVSTELNLGTRYDSAIPAALKQAFKNFETRLSLPYMRVEFPVEISEGETSILLIDALQNKSENYSVNQIKKISYVAFPDQAGPLTEYTYIPKVDRVDVAEVDDANSVPGGYWITGVQEIRFDRGADQDYVYNGVEALDNSIKIGMEIFTDFSRVIGVAQDDAFDSSLECQEEFDAERWLLANAERALMLRTCLNFATTIRDPKLLAGWRMELYGTGQDDSTNSEWDLLVNMVEEWDATNAPIFLNPFRSKGAV